MSDHHISSAKFLWGVGTALFILTFITVAVTWIQVPEPWNVFVAIGIASIKAGIVVSFFMNLYWDSKFHTILLFMGVAFFLLLIGITLLDTLFRIDPIPSF